MFDNVTYKLSNLNKVLSPTWRQDIQQRLGNVCSSILREEMNLSGEVEEKMANIHLMMLLTAENEDRVEIFVQIAWVRYDSDSGVAGDGFFCFNRRRILSSFELK